MRGPHPHRSVIVVSLAAVLFAACGNSDDDDGQPAESAAVAAESPDTSPVFVRTSDQAGEESAPPAPGSAPAATTGEVVPITTSVAPVESIDPPVVAPVPETGVPGIESDDVFCRSWSEFAGSFQALSLSSGLGDPAEAIRLEVLASPAVTGAVEQLGANLPPGLQSEREILLDDFVGPFTRRSGKAFDELLAAGVSNPGDLGAAWLAQLAETGVDDPDITVALPDSIDGAAFDAAVESFAGAVPGLVQDPSLVTDASIPLTERYLATNCPDGGTLGGNDIVD